MALTYTPICEFDLPAQDFSLPDFDGKRWTLQDCQGARGTLVMFICNHCPYVQSIREELVKVTNKLQEMQVLTVAIMSNDFEEYPDDAPSEMKKISQQLSFGFPYLVDADQKVAKAYGAVCTPDFFGYNSKHTLHYRGNFDELLNSMTGIAQTGKGPEKQIPSMGCNIKWKINSSPDA